MVATECLLALLQDKSLPELPSACWDEIANLAELHGLYPVLMLRHRAALPEALVARWRPAMHRLTSHNWGLARDESHILALLAGAGIPVAPLKGVRLAEALYGTVGSRPIMDIDILVQSEDVDAAAACLHEAGWHETLKGDFSAAHARRRHHHWVFVRDGEHLSKVILELHWSLMRSSVLSLSPELLWEHIERPTPDSWVLRPELQYVHLALHLFQHSFAPFGRVVDLAAFLDRFGADLDGQRLAALCPPGSERRRIVAATSMVVAHALAQPLPEVIEALATPTQQRAGQSLQPARLFETPRFAFSRYYLLAARAGAWRVVGEQAGRSLFDPYDVELTHPLDRLLHPLRLVGRYGSRLWQQATTTHPESHS